MPELSAPLEVTESHWPLRLETLRPGRAGSVQLSPTRQAADVLGSALLRLNADRHVLDLMETTITGRMQPAVDFTDRADSKDSSDCHASILPLPLRSSALADESPGHSDRRRFPRRSSECAVALIERHQTSQLTPQEIDWLLQSSRHVGRLLDISQTGLCLLLDCELQNGTEVLLRISNHDLNRHVDSSATVLRSQSAGHGKVSVHCAVQREFSLDQLQDLGRPQFATHVLA